MAEGRDVHATNLSARKVPQEINGEYSGLASVAQSFPVGNAETIETGTTILSVRLSTALETELLCHIAAITHMI